MATIAERPTAGPGRGIPRAAWWALGGLAVLAVLVISGAVWLHHDLTSFIRNELLPEWRSRYDSEVTVEDLSVRVFPSVSVQGRNLLFRQHGREGEPPLLSVHLVTATAGIAGVLFKPHRIRRLELVGCELNVPPKDERPPKPKKEGTVRTKFSIDDIRADNSVLRLLPKTKDGKASVFQFRVVRLHNSAGVHGEVAYRTVLNVPKPPGEVRSEGSFGPWDTVDVGELRVSGNYHYLNADMGVFPLVVGTLASQGKFSGILRQIDVTGTATIPDFEVREAKHPVKFTAAFQAVVNGTNGDAVIRSLEADFLHNHVTASGQVAGQDGKTVSLTADMRDGRLEDVLRWILHDPTPPFSGSAGFHWRYNAPLSGPNLVDRLRIEGTAALAGVTPGHAATREKLNELSAKAQGDPGASVHVASDVHGSLDVHGGIAHLSGVIFRTPGAAVTLAGTYGLRHETLSLRGTARLEAELSETTTGVKSFFLKFLDPFFKRKHAGAAVPISITGTARHPSVHLGIGR